jgi:hypothetical protein
METPRAPASPARATPPRVGAGALGGAAALAVAVLTLGATEAAVRAAYEAPGELPRRVRAAVAALDAPGRDVLVFGTCLGEETLDHTSLAGALGPDARVHSLASAGTAPLDWYLALRNVLEPSTVDLVTVAFAPGDLRLPGLTWQTQTVDMADWTSIREVAWWSCTRDGATDPECVAELYLRKSAHLYRNRAYLANRAWHALGLRAAPVTEAGGGPTMAPGPLGVRGAAPATALYWVRRFVEVVRDAGKEPLFVELPRNPEHGTPADRALREDGRQKALASLSALGVEVYAPPPPVGEYTDDVHVTAQGRALLTASVAEWLRTRLSGGGASPRP